jgi:tRNA 5-methylaminomethyl-2-thiouridine biosynthesis bifunctional protein
MSAAPVIVPAERAFSTDGTPYAPGFDDIYHNARGALGQVRHVFLGGTGLPQRWRGARRFTILETGFGTGLNFLATWQAWRDDPARSDWLHFVSIEKHPLRATALPAASSKVSVGMPAASAAASARAISAGVRSSVG